MPNFNVMWSALRSGEWLIETTIELFMQLAIADTGDAIAFVLMSHYAIYKRSPTDWTTRITKDERDRAHFQA
ncbi:hypothetical protein SPRG_01273 [Saprolegnia parasitica CBS 223.65]|uniref:Uncharacterized protein n=1 Tax=Saprolegnia parasitica (strain CBS 223.65) TaxID=695850 RepID=A0A067CTG3_SAPPC|nr:hypothetical protein SPRG_01273 [Saprolegnia parasitica CBS 223.65]KDO33999.1 hypothetical protein SPRG_01273 [Saprolegnia parasitica CBS 223.65]|eukprot:XP_012194885.1 hypothetical protein SPRG_01273 [Saprolegnia parasitica CBS 223.65]